MTSIAEKKMISIQKEVDNLRTRIQKKEDQIKKNLAKCEKLGCSEWTEEEFAEKRLAKATEKAFEVSLKIDEEKAIEQKEESWISAIQKSEKEYEAWLKQFKAECLLDGITIEYATNALIAGKTKSGKQFTMYMNNGWTDRSRHCYTLTIEKDTIFTSGLFSTGYSIIKR